MKRLMKVLVSCVTALIMLSVSTTAFASTDQQYDFTADDFRMISEFMTGKEFHDGDVVQIGEYKVYCDVDVEEHISPFRYDSRSLDYSVTYRITAWYGSEVEIYRITHSATAYYDGTYAWFAGHGGLFIPLDSSYTGQCVYAAHTTRADSIYLALSERVYSVYRNGAYYYQNATQIKLQSNGSVSFSWQ